MFLAYDDCLKERIERKIDELGEYYNQNKGVILTETDLQCLLYSKLLEIDYLKRIERTANEELVFTHYVHTEVSWFDNDGNLTLKPDISLINPNSLKVGSGQKTLAIPASKGFYFEGGGIILELKFNRYKSTKNFLKEIKKDFNKFKKLQRLHRDIFCYFVVFNKTDNKSEELEDFIQNYSDGLQHKLIYKSGNL